MLAMESCYRNTNDTKTQHRAHSHQQLQLQHGQHLTLLRSTPVEDVVLLLHDRVPVRRAGHIHQDLQQQRSCISPGPRTSSASLLVQPAPCTTPPPLPRTKQLSVPCLADARRAPALNCNSSGCFCVSGMCKQTQKWWAASRSHTCPHLTFLLRESSW